MWATVKFVIVVVVAQRIFHNVYDLGFLTYQYMHYPGPCRQVENMQLSSEDFHTLPNGLTFITSGFRNQEMTPGVDEYFDKNNITGKIYLFDFKKMDAGVKELKIIATSQFNVDTFYPHGISVWEDKKSGRHTVFVVNHRMEHPYVDRIEKFVFDPQNLELLHQGSYFGEKLFTVNDVVATSENSFYFTNYQYFRKMALLIIETLWKLPLTDVVYYDGKNYTSVAAEINSPNGIAMSNDGMYIYVAACLGKEIRVFKRNADNSLTLHQVFPLHTNPDNIIVDPVNGDLYVGCHPIGYQAFLYFQDPQQKIAPSQVLHLRVKDGNITTGQELFYDHGDLISGSSSAVVYDRKLLIGSVLDVLVTCDVNIPL